MQNILLYSQRNLVPNILLAKLFAQKEGYYESLVNWAIPLFRLALLLNYYYMFTPKSVEFTTLSQLKSFS